MQHDHMTDKMKENFNEAMELSKKYAADSPFIIGTLILENCANRFIEYTAESYKMVEDSANTIIRDSSSGKMDTYHCGMLSRNLAYANSHLISALHSGLINCVDGKFTISEKVENV